MADDLETSDCHRLMESVVKMEMVKSRFIRATLALCSVTIPADVTSVDWEILNPCSVTIHSLYLYKHSWYLIKMCHCCLNIIKLINYLSCSNFSKEQVN